LTSQEKNEGKAGCGMAAGYFLLAVALIAAIGMIKSRVDNPPIAVTHQTGNPAHDRLSALDPITQANALARIVESSGDACSGGENAFFMGQDPSDLSALWSVQCANNRESYQVEIKADPTGHTNVVECSLIKAVANIDCSMTLDSQNNRPKRTDSQREADLKAYLKHLSPAKQQELRRRMLGNAGVR
jgi:hypothetical protein